MHKLLPFLLRAYFTISTHLKVTQFQTVPQKLFSVFIVDDLRKQVNNQLAISIHPTHPIVFLAMD